MLNVYEARKMTRTAIKSARGVPWWVRQALRWIAKLPTYQESFCVILGALIAILEQFPKTADAVAALKNIDKLLCKGH